MHPEGKHMWRSTPWIGFECPYPKNRDYISRAHSLFFPLPKEFPELHKLASRCHSFVSWLNVRSNSDMLFVVECLLQLSNCSYRMSLQARCESGEISYSTRPDLMLKLQWALFTFLLLWCQTSVGRAQMHCRLLQFFGLCSSTVSLNACFVGRYIQLDLAYRITPRDRSSRRWALCQSSLQCWTVVYHQQGELVEVRLVGHVIIQ